MPDVCNRMKMMMMVWRFPIINFPPSHMNTNIPPQPCLWCLSYIQSSLHLNRPPSGNRQVAALIMGVDCSVRGYKWMLSAVWNVINVYVRLDDFLKCFIIQGQGQVRHRPCVIKKQLGTSLARRGSVWKEQHLTWHQISLTKKQKYYPFQTLLTLFNFGDKIGLF